MVGRVFDDEFSVFAAKYSNTAAAAVVDALRNSCKVSSRSKPQCVLVARAPLMGWILSP